jgi:hypothetical protein
MFPQKIILNAKAAPVIANTASDSNLIFTFFLINVLFESKAKF